MRRRAYGTLLVGRSSLVLDGLSRILSAAAFKVLGFAERVQDLTSYPDGSLLLVLDCWGGDADEAGQIGAFKERLPAGRVAVIADERRPGRMMAAFGAGANVYFVRSITAEAFVKGLELVMLGETMLPPELLGAQQAAPPSAPDKLLPVIDEPATRAPLARSRLMAVPTRPSPAYLPRRETPPLAPNMPSPGPVKAADGLARLSPREQGILRCLAEGGSNKVIARKMNISDATVKVHVKAILRKIGVSNRTQAAIWILNNGPAAEQSGKVVELPLRVAGVRDGFGG
jgi:two-component system, NarL family, nitrate/nitrite response regulator NarL